MKAKRIVEVRLEQAMMVCEDSIRELMKDYKTNKKEILAIRREKTLYQSFINRLNIFDGSTSDSSSGN